MKVTIMGAGAYGIGIASQIAKNIKGEVMLWTASDETLKDISQYHKSKVFPNKILPKNITITKSYEESLNNTSLIFLITSAKYIPSILKEMRPFYKNTPICIASKGIDNNSLNVLSNVVKSILKTTNIAVISGPTFAIDLINNEPAALALAGLNKKVIKLVQDTLANETLKLRISSDIIGIQLCGSIKNVIAIAAGILKGLGYSESTQAFLINESLHDMKNILSSLGGKKKTILSFAGVGDLLLTCSSEKSRNYTFGYLIGSKKSKDEANLYLENNTVEGYYTLNSLYQMLKKKGTEVPLINLIYDIVNFKKDAHELATFLILKK